MWIGNVILFSIVFQHVISEQSKPKSRPRRYLLFTSSTQWGVFVTISVPLHPETYTSVAWFFEANYYTVANATYFDPVFFPGILTTVSRDRKDRSTSDGYDVVPPSGDILTRRQLYTLIETMLEKHGHGGRACLLRAICENGTSHFLHNGLLGDLLHLVLTPSTSMSEDEIEDFYYEAEYFGIDGKCENYVDDCTSNPLEYISIYIHDYL